MTQSNQLVKLWSGKRGLKATVTVRASADDVAAFLHDYESEYYNEAADKDPMVRDRFKVEDSGGRSHVTYSRVRMPRGRYRDRVVCSKNTVSVKNPAGAVMYVSFPTAHDNAPEQDEHVRASCIWVFRIKPWEASVGATARTEASARSKISLELYAQVDFKTKNARMELDELSRPLTVRAVSQVQRYFQHLSPLESLDAADGVAMGVMLMDSVDAFKKGSSWSKKLNMGRLALSVMMEKNSALRKVHAKNSWFSAMLIKVLNNKPAPPSTVDKTLEELTAADGGKIGKSLSAMLLGNATADAAVDEWVRTFPSMKEFAEKTPFFRPFMEKVATQQLQAADWGMKFRVGLGAAFSVFDMGSDAFVVSELFAAGESGKAWAMIAMLTLNLLSQLLIVYIQKRKRPKIMAKDMLLTAMCLKPAVDALRVIEGGEGEHYEAISPFMELVATKITEVFCEALPAAFIQADFIITRVGNGESVSIATFGSIAMSIMATAYALQTMTYDLDVDPVRRRLDPKVYGFVPDKNRGLVLGLMISFSACTMTSQIFNAVLLSKIGGLALALYLVVPMVLFFARKLLRRGDFWGGNYPFPLLVNCIWLIASKLVIDFTAWTMTYLPIGSGGVGYMGHLLVNQCGTLVVAVVAGASVSGLNGDVIWTAVLASNGALVLSLAAFFAAINRSHVSAFFSFETLGDQFERLFYEHTEPELKLDIVTYHEAAYRHFRDDVKEYVEANIAEWEEERPLWWTNKLLAGIPDDMLLASEGGTSALRRKRALELGDEKRKGGRRNSMSLKKSLGIEDEEDDDDDDRVGEGGGEGRVRPIS
ncbi:hypothetical protein TeGR_g2179 [Tetraparma gracilis]|uniref:Uncharacterized protein n=1 Tax=Tetraparma gracilis TaxID=2962635 RepID=A0ABQ6MTM6_9STRA|nr:hypothetical protein TeGR_g2179 [Tetraparma gracilis]